MFSVQCSNILTWTIYKYYKRNVAYTQQLTTTEFNEFVGTTLFRINVEYHFDTHKPLFCVLSSNMTPNARSVYKYKYWTKYSKLQGSIIIIFSVITVYSIVRRERRQRNKYLFGILFCVFVYIGIVVYEAFCKHILRFRLKSHVIMSPFMWLRMLKQQSVQPSPCYKLQIAQNCKTYCKLWMAPANVVGRL